MKVPRTSIAMVGMVIGVCFGAMANTTGSASTAKSGGGGVWTQDFDAAKELAKEKGLPLFLNFTGSDWCGWCIMMDRQVFATTEWKRFAKDNLVLVTIDFPQNKSLVPANYVARNQALQKTHGVSGYPTYILLSSDGQRKLGRLGASRDVTPQKFIDSVKKVTKSEQIEKLSDADRATYDELAGERTKIQEEQKAWLDTKPDLKNAVAKRKQDDFQRRIDAVDKKINAFLDKR